MRRDLHDRFKEVGLPVLGIDDLLARAAALAVHPILPRHDGRTVAIVEYRDGSVSDTIPAAA